MSSDHAQLCSRQCAPACQAQVVQAGFPTALLHWLRWSAAAGAHNAQWCPIAPCTGLRLSLGASASLL
jgi:hypothetical protein